MNYGYYFLFITMIVITLSCSGNKGKMDVSNTENTIEIKSAEAIVNEDETKTDDRGYIVKVGDPAPNFTMQLTNGEPITLSELRGKIIMLQFTASWCVVCRKEMPFIESDIWKKHKNNPMFRLYGIDRDEPLETVITFAKQTGVTYPLGLDPGADIFALYADRKAGITRNVIIDKEGRIVMLTRLYDEKEFAEMCKLIDKLLIN
jgi:peroxiredoxin